MQLDTEFIQIQRMARFQRVHALAERVSWGRKIRTS